MTLLTSPGEWQLQKVIPNPWGAIPLTGGGDFLNQQAKQYYKRLHDSAEASDTKARRHHYVPKTHLKRWSADGKRVWTLNTETGSVKQLGVNDVCVTENFYRVVGMDGEAHNRVELMFGAVDEEVRRIQYILLTLDQGSDLSFEDFMAAGVTAALQRMRTSQSRRLMQQQDLWWGEQQADGFTSPITDHDPLRLNNIHTEILFRTMWKAADVMTTRQLEIWVDPKGRFITSDAPVQNPFVGGVRPGLDEARTIWWPISPSRAVDWSNELTGEKVTFKRATTSLTDKVRAIMLQGRDRFIIATEDQLRTLPVGKGIPRRAQMRLRCSQRKPNGEYVEPPGCVVETKECYSNGPDVLLCDSGLHRHVPTLAEHR
ncbi:DUF4238 domain-containing protein [Arthrobacter sp. AK01]|uniref:DUF4238 domain-containing protein n=1 Tax=Arthrobacter sp. AK01 TaxID=2894084 RepID=UPI001E5368CF|nr:DUF4238 domain-containing protein [Arthrobacter sp. AK01]MCD4849676.1 DUF4238 domain-containing protein [Arthrobacter sp. AK01]